MQSRLTSLIEICLSTAIGFTVALTTQILIFPLFDIHVSAAEHIGITGIFTVVSIARGYMVRRLFNWLHYRG